MGKVLTMHNSEEVVADLIADLGKAATAAKETQTSARGRARDAHDHRIASAKVALGTLVLGLAIVSLAPYLSGITTADPSGSTLMMVIAYVAGACLLMPTVMYLTSAASDDVPAEQNAAVAIVSARHNEQMANNIAKVIDDTSKAFGIWNADCAMAQNLANIILHATKANHGVENRVRETNAEAARRDERIVIKKKRAILTTERGALTISVLNVSVSGAAVEGNMPGVDIGSAVRLGRHHATVVRKIPNGFGIVFKAKLRPTDVHADMTL